LSSFPSPVSGLPYACEAFSKRSSRASLFFPQASPPASFLSPGNLFRMHSTFHRGAFEPPFAPPPADPVPREQTRFRRAFLYWHGPHLSQIFSLNTLLEEEGLSCRTAASPSTLTPEIATETASSLSPKTPPLQKPQH